VEVGIRKARDDGGSFCINLQCFRRSGKGGNFLGTSDGGNNAVFDENGPGGWTGRIACPDGSTGNEQFSIFHGTPPKNLDNTSISYRVVRIKPIVSI
jgi:hypothetical protein